MLASAFTSSGLSLSMGVAVSRQGDTCESILHRADEALYRSKQFGRNQVQSEAPAADNAEQPVAAGA